MQSLSLSGVRRVLALGAHADDIEIGCGGTLLRLAAEWPELEVLWVVFCASPERSSEARASAAAFLKGIGKSRVVVRDHRESYLPYAAAQVKDDFEMLKREFDPQLVFTHYRDDRHQDHRLISELTWNTWRDHLILEYEIPKYDGDLGSPGVFVPLPEDTCREKCRLIAQHFASQRARDWFDEAVFMGLMRLRGMEARSASGYAEAFYARKLVLTAPSAPGSAR
jgi:LmbE family N-acetylglucosaminyl deacetylase